MSSVIGYMPMPAGFPYADVYKKGRPRHGIPGKLATYDTFYIKHPPMENRRRAKIFAPFDALRGFSAALMEAEASAAADLPQDLSDTVMENQVRLPLHLRLSLVNDNETVPVVDVGQRRSGPDLE